MKHEDFALENATPVHAVIRSGFSLPFGKSKSQPNEPAKDVKLPAALMDDDFFSGF